MSPTASAAVLPSVADVERIVSRSDPVVRNLQITQAYYELSHALGARIAARASWCTFATWASKQAGVTIRGEDLGAALERLLAHSPELAERVGRAVTLVLRIRPRLDPSRLHRVIHEALSPSAAVRRVSPPIAEGNRLVFAEIGKAFAGFLALLEGDRITDAALVAFQASFRPGDPPDGQGLLSSAFGHYAEALRAHDPKVRDESMLLANLQIGLHEQTRLQPQIRAALEAPLIEPDELATRLIEAIVPGGRGAAQFVIRLLRFARMPLEPACERIVDLVQAELRSTVTRSLMVLRLPDRSLRLAEDIDRPYPETLQKVEDPELEALLARLDPNASSFEGSGAEDWSDLTDRMHYAAEYFRAYHDHAPSLEPPFTIDQMREIEAGRVPTGRL